MDLLIVTGLSGAGKSQAVHALEDIGFFCIDNIPAVLLAKLLDFLRQEGKTIKRMAVVIDARSGKSKQEFQNALEQLEAQQITYRILFLDAADAVLERRYEETRRRHPISILMQSSTQEAIRTERKILEPVYEIADYCIDTSLLSPPQLRDRVISMFKEETADAMMITVFSFGFKYGQPKDADLIFDVRCLPNPYYVPELKHKTGQQQEVVDYIMKFEESKEFLKKLKELIGFALPLYEKEGKSQLAIAFGCTGGRHRSVAFAEMLTEFIRSCGYHPVLQHRDAGRTNGV